MKIISLVGARPNFMKIAPFIKAIEKQNEESNSEGQKKIQHVLVHTGQHYDDKMSKNFFDALNIPEADINLNIGSGSHAEQVGYTMIAFEKVLKKEKPDWVIVVGDVNATLAGSVTAKKEHIKCAHIEAGLRSGDIKMPEEINRLVTDRLSDLLFTPDILSNQNLINEGVSENKIKFVGNIMIDTLEANRTKAEGMKLHDIIIDNLLFNRSFEINKKGKYAIITMHRPSNVDHQSVLAPIIKFLIEQVASDMPVIWPIHPRTEKQLKNFGLWDRIIEEKNLILLHPIGYHELLRLNMDASIMLTDSGGLQEECTILGTPCLTLRWNTERPVTLRDHGGASILVGNDVEKIEMEYQKTLNTKRKPDRPELWDGKTADRIVEALINFQ